jgi:hypothetical protein
MSGAPEHSSDDDSLTGPEASHATPDASALVIVRFFGRLLVIILFASVSQNRFSQAFTALLGMIITICAVWAVAQREHPFERHLTHWDECAAYALLATLTHALAS